MKLEIEHLIALLAAMLLLGGLAYFHPEQALPIAIGAYTTVIASLRGSLFSKTPLPPVPVKELAAAVDAVASPKVAKVVDVVAPLVEAAVKS